MSYVAVAIGGSAVIGGAVSYFGGQQAANTEASAANASAQAQAQAAANQLAFQKQSQQNALGLTQNALALTPSVMSNYDQILGQQEGLVQQQESLASSLNPNLVAAGADLNQLLQGGNSPMTANIQAQRQNQRAQLVNQLQASGVGANSSAGMQQLQQFDLATQNAVTSANQQYTSQLGSLQTSLGGLAGQLNQNASSANNAAGQMNQNNPALQNIYAQAGVFTGNLANTINQAGNQVTGAAGLTGAGQMIQGQAQANQANSLGSQFSTLGGSLGGYISNQNLVSAINGLGSTSGGTVGSSLPQLQMPTLGSSAGYGSSGLSAGGG